MHSMRPPLSSSGRPSPARESTVRAMPVKLITSAYRDMELPQTRHSSRSASWLYCSGTTSIRPPLLFPTAAAISSMTARVLPVPARPVYIFSMVFTPLPHFSKTAVRFPVQLLFYQICRPAATYLT